MHMNIIVVFREISKVLLIYSLLPEMPICLWSEWPQKTPKIEKKWMNWPYNCSKTAFAIVFSRIDQGVFGEIAKCLSNFFFRFSNFFWEGVGDIYPKVLQMFHKTYVSSNKRENYINL